VPGRVAILRQRDYLSATPHAEASASDCRAPAALWDEFEVETDVDHGTTVTMTKWRQRDDLAQLRERRKRTS
jgi:hypothetical protein